MTQQQTPNEPMRPSVQCDLEMDRWAGDWADIRNRVQVIAESTGCDEAMELLRTIEWVKQPVGDYAFYEECHFCGRNTEHAPDCRLAAYLKRYGGQP